MKETKVICPVCGTEIAISEREHAVKNAVVIGKDSNLGTVVLPVAKEGQAPSTAPISTKAGGLPNKAEDRLEALKKAGIDTSNLFAMRGASGEGMLVRLINGVPQMVEDSDPIYRAIIAAGTIPDRRLFRRWVMSQMFHMLTYKGYHADGYTAALHAKGYEYQWSMLIEELRVQMKLVKNDTEKRYIFAKFSSLFHCRILSGRKLFYRLLFAERCMEKARIRQQVRAATEELLP